MKKSANQKTTLQNLCEIIDVLSDEDFGFIKSKLTKAKTTAPIVSEIRYKLKESKETPETIDLSMLTMNGIKSDKILENAYKSVLNKVADLRKSSHCRKWQLEIAQGLEIIEGLCSLTLYDQAAAQLKHLEHRLAKKGFTVTKFYDDVSLGIRMVQLKIRLAEICPEILDKNELQDFIARYFSHGESVLKGSVPSKWEYTITQQLGFGLMAEYAKKRNDYKSFLAIKDKQINSYPHDKNFNEIRSFLKMEVAVASLIHGDLERYRNTIKELKKETLSPVLLVLFEQRFFNLSIGHDINFYDPDLLSAPKNLILFTSLQIEQFKYRIEINALILHFLSKEYDKCLDLIGQLKSIREIVRKDNPMYMQILLLEAMTLISLKRTAETDGIIRSIKSICHKPDFEFEEKAVQLLGLKSKSPLFSDFKMENVEAINSLALLKKIDEPIQNIIIAFLNGKT